MSRSTDRALCAATVVSRAVRPDAACPEPGRAPGGVPRGAPGGVSRGAARRTGPGPAGPVSGRHRAPGGLNLDGVGLAPDAAARADRPPGAARRRACEVPHGPLATLPDKDRG